MKGKERLELKGQVPQQLSYFQRHKGFLYTNLVMLAGSAFFFFLGRFCADHADDVFGIGSWKTPNFLGNSGRSPIFPFLKRPYTTDVEGRLAYDKTTKSQFWEVITTNRIG